VLRQFLNEGDAERASGVLAKLARHDISRWVLTGGLAVEIHALRHGCTASLRALNDLDFIAESFDCVPETLARDFVFQHVHPFDPPGKTMVQFFDPDTATRIDVFRAYGAIMSRADVTVLPSGPIRLISLEDLVARGARLVLDLAQRVPVPKKHVDDYLRLIGLVQPPDVEPSWREHRKPMHPATFLEAKSLLNHLIPSTLSFQTTVEYSKAPAGCPRCKQSTKSILCIDNLKYIDL
jgi:hypothetical protein